MAVKVAVAVEQVKLGLVLLHQMDQAPGLNLSKEKVETELRTLLVLQ
jgi:hypothetical protein